MADSSKAGSPHPGMRSFAHGIVTVVEKNFSKLLAQCKSNEELKKSKSFEKMYYAKYGPFTVGDIELEIRIYPVREETVEVHVCLLRNAGLVKKFLHTLVFYDKRQNLWRVSYGGKGSVPMERDFKAETGSIGEGLNLPMVYIDYFDKADAQDDHILFEVAFWFVLTDDSKKPADKPAAGTWQVGTDNFWDRPVSG